MGRKTIVTLLHCYIVSKLGDLLRKTPSFLLSFLLLVTGYWLLATPPRVGAVSKVGVNIAARHEEFDDAANIVGPGGYVVIMSSNANKLQEILVKRPDTNIVLRGHCPSDPLGPDDDANKLFALSWAATLGSLDTAGRRIYFMPWNEPNMTRECGDVGDDFDPNNTECAPYVRNYIRELKRLLDSTEMGNIGGKVALLSPMINQHHANFDQFVSTLGPGFFNQFEGISMNLYDNETCGGPLCQADPHFNAGKFATILDMVSPTLPAFGVETGLIDKSGTCPSGVTDCPLFEDGKMRAFFEAAWGFSWRDSGRLKMFSPLSYNPETNVTSWIYGSSTADYMQSIRGGGDSAKMGGFDSVKFQGWLNQALTKEEGKEGKIYKCPGLENSYAADLGMCNFCAAKKADCCGANVQIDNPKCAKEVTECMDRAMLPASLQEQAGFAAAGTGLAAAGGNYQTTGVREFICERFDWIDVVKRVLCEFAEVSKVAAGLVNPSSNQPEVEEPPEQEEVEGMAQVQGINPTNWIWRIIGKNTVEEKTGWLGRARFAGEATSGIGEDEVLSQYESARCKYTPSVLLEQSGCGESYSGEPGDREPGLGTCAESTREHCTVENLRGYFGDQAGNASQICNRESGGEPFALNDHCDPFIGLGECEQYRGEPELYNECLTYDPANSKYADDKRTKDYSVGLFQINLIAHCGGAFSAAPSPPGRCEIGDLRKLVECRNRFYNVEENIAKAVELSNGGQNWCGGRWGGAFACKVVTCEECGVDPAFCEKYGN